MRAVTGRASERAMSSTIVFDIESIPDVAGLRTLHGLDASLSDAEVAEFAFQKQRAKNGSDFLPHYLQRVIVISYALRDGEKFLVRLPVLHYRGLINGAVAPRYWEMGEGDYRDARDFKWNNYIGRYHMRHLDLMDLLAMYQPRASAPLDQLAKLMGLPGKQSMAGDAVWPAWLDGRIDDIRDYCETDVVNTYLVYLRFQKMRGMLTPAEHDTEVAFVREHLAALKKPHWEAFLAEG